MKQWKLCWNRSRQARRVQAASAWRASVCPACAAPCASASCVMRLRLLSRPRLQAPDSTPSPQQLLITVTLGHKGESLWERGSGLSQAGERDGLQQGRWHCCECWMGRTCM